MSNHIRLATEADAPAIQAIYAPYVRNTPISFETEAPSVDEMRKRIVETLRVFPWLVCDDATGEVAGYAYASPHRERAAYRWAVDVAAYVRPDAQRKGVGRALYASLFALLRHQGFFKACAGITLPNEASVGLHTAMGFQPVGVYREIGYKLGRWHDVAWYELSLQPYLALEPALPSPLEDLLSSASLPSLIATGERFLKL